MDPAAQYGTLGAVVIAVIAGVWRIVDVFLKHSTAQLEQFTKVAAAHERTSESLNTVQRSLSDLASAVSTMERTMERRLKAK